MMPRLLRYAPVLLALAGCAPAADDATTLRQAPIDFHDWGVYHWTLVTEGAVYGGHVVVRGEEASAIEGLDFAPGTETWFFDEASEGSGEAKFVLRLDLQRSPRDRRLVSTIAEIAETETELGSMLIDPQWEEGATLSDGPAMTLTDCDGPEACPEGFERISIQFPHPEEAIPTIYADSDAIVSIFSGESEAVGLSEGHTAVFTEVDEESAGYPDGGWFFVGFDPS